MKRMTESSVEIDEAIVLKQKKPSFCKRGLNRLLNCNVFLV